MHCLFLLAIDLLIVFASSITAILLTSNLHLEIGSLIQAGAAYGLLMCAGTIPLFVATGLHRRLWRFASLQDCLRILLALGIATLAVAATANNYPSVPGGKSLLFHNLQ
jgi:FlaA1/EpsC-like NDP-sugar epimerase